MSKKKWNSCILKLFLIFVLLAGCSFKVPYDPYTFVQSIVADPDRLNPIISSSAYSLEVDSYIYESLIDLDNETLEPKPKLATSWDISKDYLQYTFHLRKDVPWQDGKPFTAKDVVYTYDQIMNPKVDAGPARSYFKDIIRAEALNPYTVRFTLNRPNIDAMITLGLMRIIPKHIFDNGEDFNAHSNNRQPIGTGPFRFVEWKTGRRILLKKNEEYWGEPYHFDQILFKIIPENLTSFWLFKKKGLDVLELSSLQWARQTESKKFQKEFQKHKLYTLFAGYNYIGWNLRHPIFQDRRVRWAFAHLIDRQEINEKLLFNLRYQITGPYHPLRRNYNHRLKEIPYDLEKAKQLLQEAGWEDRDGDGIREKNGVPLRFSFLSPGGSPFHNQFVFIFRENLRAAGVDLELRQLDFVTMYKLIHDGDFDAYMGGWMRSAGEEDLYQIFHSSQIKGGSNYVGYSNPEVDRLLVEARGEFDDQKRAALYQKVHALIYEDQPYLFMYIIPDLFARSRRFGNVKEYPVGFDYREWKVVP